MKGMIRRIAEWFKSLFTKENARKLAQEVRQTVVATASETVNGFINDPKNQAAARDVVAAVAKDGLSGNEALDAAVNRLRDAGIAAGKDAATTLLRTLVQMAYAVARVA